MIKLLSLFLLFCVPLQAVPPIMEATSSSPQAGRGDDPESRRWYVYRDAIYSENHGHWTNFMTVAGRDPGDVINLSMVEEANAYSKPMCVKVSVRFTYSWAGVAISSAPDYWGKSEGPAYDLSKAEKLVFYARGEKGNEAIRIKAAVAGGERFGDSAKVAPSSELIMLTDRWTRHEISLKDFDLKRVITPFVVIAEKVYNQSSEITFYLDEIYYVMKEDVRKVSSLPRNEAHPFFSYLKDESAALVAFSPTNHDPRPASRRIPSRQSLIEDLQAIRPAFDGLVLYGFDSEITPAIVEEARRLNFRAALLGIWDPKSEAEIAGTASLVRKFAGDMALAVCIGNEGIAFNRYTLEDLKAAEEKLKRFLGPRLSVPYCTSEPFGQYGQARLREFGNFLAPNIHPAFDKPGLCPSEAVLWVRDSAIALAELSRKPLLVKESAFPHGGDAGYNTETQQAFWRHYVSRPRVVRISRGDDVWASFSAAFEAFDLPWKATQANLKIEENWGLLASDRKPLPAFKVWKELRSPAKPQPSDLVEPAYRFLKTGMDQPAHGTVIYRNKDDGLAGFFPSNRPKEGDIEELEFNDNFQESVWNTSIRISYTPGPKKRAGLFWAYPDLENGNWGNQKGRSIKGARSVRFRARSETSAIIEFIVGGVNRPPYNDPTHHYQDQFGPIRRLIQLSPQWQEHTIELPEDAPLDCVIGGFGFTISAIYNRDINPGFGERVKGRCVFYLDDITYDDADPDMLRLIRSFVPIADSYSRLRIDLESDYTMKRLKQANVPPSVIQAVKTVMNTRPQDDYWFENESKFLDELKKVIGDQETQKYRELILSNASREDWAIRNASHTYDMSLAILVFLSRSDSDGFRRARILADALVWAQEHDRYYKGDRWRNAYSSGPIGTAEPNPVARIPGFYNGRWFEDGYAVGTDVGNTAWTIIALISAHRILEANWKDSPYLRAAKRAGDWIVKNHKKTDEFGGFSGGFEGWEQDSADSRGPKSQPSTWRSSEHAIDLYAAFLQLSAATGDKRWEREAIHARNFIMKMWACNEEPSKDTTSKKSCGFFWTGIKPEKVEINRDVVPLDVQAWGVLSMGHDSEFRRVTGWSGPPAIPSCIDWVEAKCKSNLQPASKAGPVYKFSDKGTGLWFEGTAQMAAVYHYLGRDDEASKILNEISRLNPPGSTDSIQSGEGIYAAWKERAWTGYWKYFGLIIDGKAVHEKWNYAVRPHVGATAWFLLAANGTNPYWLSINPINPGK